MQKYKLHFIKILLASLLSGAAWMPILANASSVTLSSADSTYHVGDSFLVTMKLDAGSNSINTLSGKVVIPTDYFQASNLRYGNSIVTLWVEKPALDDSTGQITFSGGIPGGFNSRTGTILTFSLKAKKAGTATLAANDIKILLNDGQGTELAGVATPVLNINISKAALTPIESKIQAIPKTKTYLPITDIVPPENFLPLVSRHPSIGNNSYFVSFSAVDKDSGISHYEVKETPWIIPFGGEDWTKAESPYILKNQLWMTSVVVRAFDQSGNYVDSETYKPFDPMFAAILTAIIMSSIIYLSRLSTSKPVRAGKRMVKSS